MKKREDEMNPFRKKRAVLSALKEIKENNRTIIAQDAVLSIKKIYSQKRCTSVRIADITLR